MDPVSVLSIAAASAQFVEQATSLAKFLWGLYSNLKDAPKSIRGQIVQIEQLLALARLFLQNPSLQMNSVASILGTCISCAQEFHDMLKKVSVVDRDGRFKKLKKSFKVVMQEKQIVGLFENLEREKSSLMLSVQQIDDKLLHTISIDTEDIKVAVGALPDMSTQVRDIHTVVKSLETLTLQHQILTNKPPPTCHFKKYDLVPKRRVRDFIGRENILAKIEAGFSSGQGGPRVVVVRGLGGQGKTQVALEYCRRAKKCEMRGIFWVDAMSEDSVKKSFEAISESMKNPGQILQDDLRVRFVMEQLEAWPDPWIIVLDNHDDPSAFTIQDYIPQSEHGRILVTSRHADTDSLTDPERAIELKGLPNGDALELLLKQSQLQETQGNVEYGSLIVKRLGYHALAITQAGSYIYLRRIELGTFLKHYNQQRKEILLQTPRMSQYRRTLNKSAKETALNVFTTWELSFQQLLKQDTPTFQKSRILTLFAFFDCNAISEQLFKVYCDEIKPLKESEILGDNLIASFTNSQDVWNHETFVGAIVALAQMSLVQSWSRDQTDLCHLNLHPLIKDWIRLRIDIASFQVYSILAAEVLAKTIRCCYEQGQFKMPLSNRKEVLLHLATHKDNLQFLEDRLEADAFYAVYRHFVVAETWFSYFLGTAGNLSEYVVTSRRVAVCHARHFGLEDGRTLVSQHRYADALLKHGQYEEAEKHLRQALRSFEKSSGSGHLVTLQPLRSLSEALSRQAKHKEAEEVCRLAIQYSETTVEQEHLYSVAIRHNLALILSIQNKYEEAEKIYRDVLRHKHRILGLDHSSTLGTLSHLAHTLHRQEKYVEAEKLYQQAIWGLEKIHGQEHPDTLASLGNFAVLRGDQEMYGEALALFPQVLSGLKRVCGPVHPRFLRCENDYLKLVEKVQRLRIIPSGVVG